MTLVLHQNVAGHPRGAPVALPSRRRRLSTITRRYAPAGRPHIVSVHRKGEVAFAPTDHTVRLRGSWPKTLVGPHDVVLITVLPLGGGGGASGGGKSGLGIGLALASIALIALAGPVGGALVGTLGATGAFAVQAGMVVGGLALSFAASLANANKKKDATQEVYSVAGGGNVARPGQRKPLIYGRCWTAPPLSQPDFTMYNGSTSMTLIKRMTLGIGQFDVHQIRVGDAIFYSAPVGIHEPFLAAGAQLEILFGQASQITPGDVVSSPDVSGQALPRQGSNPEWTPWFAVSPLGVEVDQIQLDYQWPGGLVHNGTRGQGPAQGRVMFEARRLHPTGVPSGEQFIICDDPRYQRSTTAIRSTVVIPLPVPGNFEVRGTNVWYEQEDYENRATWDGLRGWINDVRIRPETTEIVMVIPAGEGLSITSFSDVMVDAGRLVPVWDGSAWSVPQGTDKAVWAFCDLVRAEYGLNLPNGADQARALHYAGLLTGRDTFNGLLSEVQSFWEAAAQVLGPMRADPVKVGTVHTFVRDESQDAARHVITRRQIVESTSQASYSFVEAEGDGADVLVEFDWGGDPKRPGEQRWSYGPPTRTPKRYRVPGIIDGVHALAHAKWLAAIAVFRGSSRTVTTEWDGRLVYPGDHILCDLWFLAAKQVYGVADRAGNTLTLDAALQPLPANPHASIRRRDGREWGIIRVAAVGERQLVLDAGDVVAIEDRTGIYLGDLFALDTQDPTTIVVGELVELQETYVARSAIPADEDRVTIEMVLDDTRVWQILGEAVQVPQPAYNDALLDPLVPQIRHLHARCSRIETSIEVVWSITPVRGAELYQVELSYDASDDDTTSTTWEPLAFNEGTGGRAAMHQSDLPATVRARAYGRTGLAGDWISVTFTTTAPSVNGSWIEQFSISLDKLFAQVRRDIERINQVGVALVARGQGTIRDELRRLEGKLEEFAAATVTEAGESYERSELVKVAAQGKRQEIFAALQEEVQIRASEVSVLTQVTETLGGRLTTAENTIVGQGVAIQGLTVSITNLNGTVTVLSQSLTSLTARVDNHDLQLSGQATAVQLLTTRVTATEGNITVQAESLTALQATVSAQGGAISGQALTISSLNATVSYQGGVLSSVASQTTALQTTQGGHTALLTQHAASIDGVRAEYGVAIAVDGRAVGGFALVGFRRLDGTYQSTFGVLGDMVVTGTISGEKLQAYNIIAVSAQIGSLTVDNLAIKDGAVTQSNGNSSGETAVAVALNTRPGAKVSVTAVSHGNPNEFFAQSTPNGHLNIFRNGVLIAQVGTGYSATSGGTPTIAFLPTTAIAIDNPPAGANLYTAQTSNGAGQGGVSIIAMELSK